MHASAALIAPGADVRRLGGELHAQAEEVVRRTVARSVDSGPALSDVVEERFERVGEVSTIAVASWMAGESPEVGHRGRPGGLADLRPARGPARGAAERGHQALLALVRRGDRGAARDGRAPRAAAGGVDAGPRDAGAQPPRDARADVRVL